MVFFDKNGNKFNFNLSESNKIGIGTNATVYKISENECLKVVNEKSHNYLKEDILNLFKQLSLPSYVKINTPFYLNGNINAYTMEYLNKLAKCILDMPTEYLLENIDRIYKDLLVLTKHLVVACDFYHENLVLGEDKITIIDYDSYEKRDDVDEVLYINISSLIYAFIKLFENALKMKGIDIDNTIIHNMTIKDYLSKYLFSYSNYSESPAKMLERKLIGTFTPMDLFRSKW